MDAAALVRPVRDGLAQQLGLGRGSQWGTHLSWAADADLQQGLGLDSIELVEGAERTSRMFMLERPGWEDYLLRDRTLHGWASVAAATLAEYGQLRFLSSGSQVQARESVHRLEALQQEAACFAASIGPRATVRVAVPTHHIYGFIFGVLLPRALGAPVVDYCGRLPSTLLRESVPGDLVVAHPLIWQALAAADADWATDITGVTSTAPCPPETIAHLRRRGLGRMLEVYGSSETAGIGWREDPASAFTLLPRWQVAHDGDTPMLVDDTGRHMAFPDQVDAGADGIRPIGRRDEAVQVAGQNVYPGEARRVLESHPSVATASVRLDECSGRLKAFVVVHSGVNPDADALRTWCRRHLGDAAAPARFRFGSELPIGVMGKAADWD